MYKSTWMCIQAWKHLGLPVGIGTLGFLAFKATHELAYSIWVFELVYMCKDTIRLYPTTNRGFQQDEGTTQPSGNWSYCIPTMNKSILQKLYRVGNRTRRPAKKYQALPTGTRVQAACLQIH